MLINIQLHADRVDLVILTAQSQNFEYTIERPDISLSVPAPHLPRRIQRICLECSFFAGTLINQPINWFQSPSSWWRQIISAIFDADKNTLNSSRPKITRCTKCVKCKCSTDRQEPYGTRAGKIVKDAGVKDHKIIIDWSIIPFKVSTLNFSPCSTPISLVNWFNYTLLGSKCYCKFIAFDFFPSINSVLN